MRAAPLIDREDEVQLAEMQEERLLEWAQFLFLKDFLKQRPLDGRIRGKALNDLVGATGEYQKANNLQQTGALNLPTVRQAFGDPLWPGVLISPNLAATAYDYRRHRPYFVVPVLESRFPYQPVLLKEQIKGLVEFQKNAGKPITDIFLLSHGWHRNYLVGVSAYDRLMSRFSVLAHRGRLKTPKDFNPLFLAVHWNSDPGPDVWLDRSGRRDKASFFANVRATFGIATDDNGNPRASDCDFVADFENLFQALSKNVAPDNDASPQAMAPLQGIDTVLGRYRLLGTRPEPVTVEEKICSLWRCYWESEAKGFLTDQTQHPKPVGDPASSAGSLVKFVVAAVGVPALLSMAGKLLSKLSPATPKPATTAHPAAWYTLDGLQGRLQAVGKTLVHWNIATPQQTLAFWTIAVGASLLGVAILYICALHQRRRKEIAKRTVPSKGFPIIQILSWVCPQVVFAGPVLLYCLVTMLFRFPLAFAALVALVLGYTPLALGLFAIFALVAWVATLGQFPLSGVFRERINQRGDAARQWRDWLAAIARWPVRLAKASVGPDSSLQAIADPLDNQLAFFAMQRKGVDAGNEAGEFLEDVVKSNGLEGCRIHLIGHSFGGLVVQNAARRFVGAVPDKGPGLFNAHARRIEGEAIRQGQTAQNATAPSAQLKVATIYTAQGAIASDWYANEEKLVSNTTGAIASQFSVYDTANGFYYPCANNARLASGFVGMCNPGSKDANGEYRKVTYLGRNGEFATVEQPPDLARDHGLTRENGSPYLLNVDASRICFFGTASVGGGHDDIFKDDQVNLLWSVVQLSF